MTNWVRSVRSLSVLAVLCALGAVPAAGAPLTMKPVSKWVVDYQVAQCVAARDFGTPANPLTLIIRPSPNGRNYELLVGRKQRSGGPAQALTGIVNFGSGPVTVPVLRYPTDSKDKLIDMFRVSSAIMTQARAASTVRLAAGPRLDATIALSAMPALLDGLEACRADLYQHWNSGGELDGRIAEPARGDLRGVFSSSDFPDAAMRMGQEGSSRFLLLVNEQGNVAYCHLEQTSGNPVFDARGCQVIRERARFKPARDRNGKPVRSMVTTPEIHWRIG